MRKNTKNTTSRAMQISRENRRDMGVAERVVWEALRNERLGFKFRRQYAAGPYFLDFFCREASLCVEIDGPMHDEFRDKIRDHWLASRDIRVLRIPTAEIFEDDGKGLQHWLQVIQETCAPRTAPHPQPPLP